MAWHGMAWLAIVKYELPILVRNVTLLLLLLLLLNTVPEVHTKNSTSESSILIFNIVLVYCGLSDLGN